MIIDTNAYLGRWPFRRTPCDELDRFLETYKKYGIAEVWVGSLEGPFHRDIGGVNHRLWETCQAVQDVRLTPFGSVNPRLPDWKEDLRRCAEQYKMPGVRLHPNYHRYRLDEPVFAELLDLAGRYGLLVQLAVRMEDVRVQDERFATPDVDLKPLAELVRGRPGLRLMLLNSFIPDAHSLLLGLVQTGQIWVEIAALDGLGALERWARQLRPDRITFGSHVPLFCLESAVLKMEESELSAEVRRAILQENARQLLPKNH